MSRWYNAYVKRMNDYYLNHVKTKYSPFIEGIKNSIKLNDNVLEVGCGASNITRILYESNLKANFIVLDNDVKMLELTRINLKNYHVDILRLDVMHLSIISTKYNIGVIHSHGLLEHFNDVDINKIIRVQKNSGAHTLIHYVPGIKYVTPSFDDERLMNVDSWKNICNPDEVITFNEEKDYILKWNLKG